LIAIAFAGDLVPTPANAAFFESGEVERVFDQELLGALLAADARVVNLEAPLYDGDTPIFKAGPALSAPTGATRGLMRLGAPIVSLANNHILDHGARGLASTLDALSAAGLTHLGAGANLAEAGRPYIYEKGGVQIGLIACAEHEFSIAQPDAPGANPFDPLETPDQVAKLREACDFVVVLYHGGVECYRYPSPGLRRTMRKLAEKGADLILCQHSHCVGCFEEHAGATIVYGQGNLLFDRKNDEYWRTALVVHATFTGSMRVQYLPVVHEGGRALLAEGDEARLILGGFEERSREILSPNFVEESFSRHAQAALDRALFSLRGQDSLVNRIDRRLGGALLRRGYTKRRLVDTINLIECEALRERLLEGLRRRSGI
jgi:hypothetical protein